MAGLTRKKNDGKQEDQAKDVAISTKNPDNTKVFKGIGRAFIVKRDYHGVVIDTNAITAESKITSKGQVTIPVAIRKELGLKNGDDLKFEMVNGAVRLKKMTAIDRLAISIGPKLREEFPTPEAFNAYLKANRKNIIKEIYGDCDTESSD